ncbi:lytic polysaccharide monooxygenase [Verrucosispora sp. NA02020]|uniref:lytic polysaccharide monooxygenase auxiliary activity family 9 protein n=1 Tax=Verrucosispora sp. NA02020 TaxID=2742132 RepID=UPI0015905061|nr:lytic polysaccharide monooxygenase [Verrucosispora sp. NA02020]QKW12459.1 lytic polysaccharide monooxygenase [Verrucosispora sp. NA02020]
MAVRRVVVVALVALVGTTTGALPAAAQGAPTYPVSRSAGCAPGGPHVGTSACLAAEKEGAALREWDNVRVYGVDGRDRETIPDGELCSGGLSAYRGLDLPRTDWPATPLTAGAEFAFQYRATAAQKGTFRLYLTRPGYTPSRALTWADLDRLPFLRITDPPLRDGTYLMSGRLPTDRSGRHVIYTIWQHSETADTYYSCSDVDVVAVDALRPGTTPASAVGGTPETTDALPGTGADAGTEAAENVPVAAVTYLDGRRWPLVAGGLLVTLLLVSIVRWLRGSRGGPPPGPVCTVRNHRANPRPW